MSKNNHKEKTENKIAIINNMSDDELEIFEVSISKPSDFNKLIKIIRNKKTSSKRKDILIDILLDNLEEELNKKRLYALKSSLSDGREIWIPTTMKTINGISDKLTQTEVKTSTETNAFGSDYDTIYEVLTTGVRDVQLIKLNKKVTNRILKNQGYFFKFLNKTTIDLADLQIFTKEQSKKAFLQDHCLVFALKQAGIDNKTICQSLINKSTIDSDKFLLRRIPEIDDNIKVILTEVKENGKLSRINYGKSSAVRTVEIFLFENHFMVNKTLPITRFAINNYNEIKELKDFNQIYRKTRYYCRSEDKFIKTEIAVPLMFKNNLFEKDEEFAKFAEKVLNERVISSFDEINLNHVNKIPVEFKQKTNKFNTFIFYGDTETIMQDETGYEELFSIGCCTDKTFNYQYFEHVDNRFNPRLTNRMRKKLIARNNGPNYEISKQLIYNFFNDIYKFVLKNIKDYKEIPKNQVILYFHNLKFDFNVISSLLSSKEFIQTKICKKEGAIYSYEFVFKSLNFKLKDTFKFVPKKLSKICEDFKVENKLDIINYEYFTYSNAPFTDLSEKQLEKYSKTFSTKQKLELEKYREPNGVNLLRLMSVYLNIDVISLAKAFDKFVEIIDNLTDLNVHSYLSISSLAFDYAKLEGCFDGCYEVKASVREYCQKALVGGRVATLNNSTHKIKRRLEDLDANNLYPSAIYKLGEDGYGIPNGRITKISNFDETFKSEKFYICRIRLKSIGKRMGIPFVSYVDDGKRRWSDEIDKYKNLEINLSKFYLEDLIKFHEIEFEFIDGIQWSGWNKNMCVLMKNLFEKRANERKTNPCLGDCIKLLMNSIYGKCALKPSNCVNKIYHKNSEEAKINIISRNYSKMITLETIGNGVCLKYAKDEYNHCNLNYVAIAILDMSKRIMNEVQYLAHNLQIPIYYQDTDSLAVVSEGVELLEKEYKKTYGSHLIGDGLCQFKSDFTSKLIKNPVSVESYFIGPKFYIHKLGSRNSGNIFDYHIRCKGVGSQAILNHCLKNNIDVMEFYKQIYEGKAIDVELVFENKPKFEIRHQKIKKLNTYKRNVKIVK